MDKPKVFLAKADPELMPVLYGGIAFGAAPPWTLGLAGLTPGIAAHICRVQAFETLSPRLGDTSLLV